MNDFFQPLKPTPVNFHELSIDPPGSDHGLVPRPEVDLVSNILNYEGLNQGTQIEHGETVTLRWDMAETNYGKGSVGNVIFQDGDIIGVNFHVVNAPTVAEPLSIETTPSQTRLLTDLERRQVVSEKYEALLTDLSDDWFSWESKNSVQEFVSGLSFHENRMLTQEEENKLMTILQSGFRTRASDTEAMRALQSAPKRDLGGEEFMWGVAETVAAGLLNSEVYSRAQAGWDDMEVEQRTEVLTELFLVSAEALEVEDIRFEVYSDLDSRDRAAVIIGTLVQDRNIVQINSAALDGSPFEEAIETVSHEASHLAQKRLLEEYWRGDVEESSSTFQYAQSLDLAIRSGEAMRGTNYLTSALEYIPHLIGQSTQKMVETEAEQPRRITEFWDSFNSVLSD